MSPSLVTLTAGFALLAFGRPRPDWADLFPPPPPNYYVSFESAAAAKDDHPDVYHLTANYGWLGNDFRTATATLARDPEFKAKYSAETMKKEGAKEITVSKKTAWVRPTKDGDKWEYELTVPLSEDKALILASHGHYGGEDALTALAAGFDMAKAGAALAKPPRAESKKE